MLTEFFQKIRQLVSWTPRSCLLALVFVLDLSTVFHSSAQSNALEITEKQLTTLLAAERIEEAISTARNSLSNNQALYGMQHTNTATALADLAHVYSELGDYTNAEPLYKHSLELTKNLLGADHQNVAICCLNYGLMYGRMHRFAEAESLLQRSKQLFEKTSGRVHRDVAIASWRLAQLYQLKNDYSRAEQAYRESLEITEKSLGPEHSEAAFLRYSLAMLHQNMGEFNKAEALLQRDLLLAEQARAKEQEAIALNNLGMLYHDRGDYNKAEPLLVRCLALREALSGAKHLETGNVLNNLVRVYFAMGRYNEAIAAGKRVLLLREEALGSDAPDTITSVQDLAVLYQAAGQFKPAEHLYGRALLSREKISGPEDAMTGYIVGALAAFYDSTGDYAKADSMFDRSLKIMEKKRGPDHSDTATMLKLAGNFYSKIGDFEKAEPLLVRALAVRQKNLGATHPDTADALICLAGFYQKSDQGEKALKLYKDNLHQMEAALGPDHWETATLLNNFAAVLYGIGDSTNAISLWKRSLEIKRKALGANHFEVALAQANLGRVYEGQGSVSKAEELYWDALHILQECFGPEHPEIGALYVQLALLHCSLGWVEDALSLARTADSMSQSLSENILSFASENQRVGYFSARDPYGLFGTIGSAPDIATRVIRYKGIVIDSLLEDEIIARESKKPETVQTVERLREAGRRLIRLQSTSKKEVVADAAGYEQLRKEIAEFEKALAKNVAATGRSRRAFRLRLNDIQERLDSKSVGIEFVCYSHYLGKRVFERRYGAVLIGAPDTAFVNGRLGEPAWVPLGDAGVIDRQLTAYKAMMKRERPDDMAVLKDLYATVFRPIQMKLPDSTQTLIISPDEELCFLSFATLLDKKDRFLAERYTLEYVSSLRDLAVGTALNSRSRSLVAFANPTFERIASGFATNEVQSQAKHSHLLQWRDIVLEPLPGSMKEAQFLQQRCPNWKLEPLVFTGMEASEAKLRSIDSPHILHLATHGFFLANEAQTGQGSPSPLTRSPMQRSGLALAGAQSTLQAWARGEVPETENDGVLTAQEVGTLCLTSTWLVSLSACNTAAGQFRSGDGVLGLRRAFIQAGAQNVLMTLWEISDSLTVEFMKTFYEQAMDQKGDAPTGCAKAQRELLVRLRSKYGPCMSARLAGPFVLTFQTNSNNESDLP